MEICAFKFLGLGLIKYNPFSMKRFLPGSFKKIVLLLLFSVSISFSSVSFAQEGKGIFDWMSSFLTTSFLSDSGSSRLSVLFASPRNNIVSSKVIEDEDDTSVKIVEKKKEANSLLDVLRSKRNTTELISVSETENAVSTVQKIRPSQGINIRQTQVQEISSPVETVIISCTDSDGGIDKTKKGSVRWTMGKKLKIFTDESVEDGIIEYSCERDSLRGDFISCEYGSKNGICETAPICQTIACAAPRPGCVYKAGKFANGCPNSCAELICEDEKGCVDSDGGMNFYEKGTLSGTINGVYQEHIDTCYTELGGEISMKGAYVKEWYCSGEDSIGSTGLTCPNGCFDGACIQESEELLTRVWRINIPNDDIIAGSSNVKVFQFVVENLSEKNMTIHNLSFRANGTGNAAVYENFEARSFIDGVQQGSYQYISANGELNFSDMATALPAHEQKEFVIILNTIEESAPGTIQLALIDVQEDLITGEAVVTMFGSAPLSSTHKMDGFIFQIVEEAVGEELITKVFAVDVPNDPVVAGSYEAQVFSFVIDNNSNENMLIKKLQFKANGTGNAAVYSNLGEARAFVDGTQQGSPENISSNGGLYFSEMNRPLSANGQTEFLIILNTLPAAAPGTISLQLEDVKEVAITSTGIETGASILTMNHAQPLSSSNPLEGQTFQIISATAAEGKLIADLGSTVYSQVFVGGQNNVQTFNIRFSAQDDDVYVKDLYLENDVNNDETVDNIDVQDRANFKLYDSNGQLLSTKVMVNGALHFEINNPGLLVPQDDSTFVTIKADIRDITQESQTGKRLRLSLDGTHATKGIKATSASTGNDIIPPNQGWEVSPGMVTGEDFVVYKSRLSLSHAPIQPSFADPSLTTQEVYRFNITTDSAGPIELGTLTFDMDMLGMQSSNNIIESGDVEIHLVQSNGVIDTIANVGEAIVTNSTATSADITINFRGQLSYQGEQKTYTISLKNLINDAQMQSDDDALMFAFKTDTAFSAPASKNNQQGNIVWSDRSSPYHSNTSSDWGNGYLLPTETTTKIITD